MKKNWQYKVSNKKYKEKYNKFLLLCEKYNAKIITFEYYKKLFGNFLIEIEYKDKLHTIIADRGEICIDGYMVCNSSYHIAGQDDTFTKLVEMLEKELLNKKDEIV